MKALVVGGAGRFGSFYAKWLSKVGWDVSIISDDHDAGRKVSNALKLSYVDDPERARDFDAVFFAVPLRDAPKIISEYVGFMKKDALLVDLSSVKSHVASQASMFPGGVVLLHPLHGPDIHSLRNITVLSCPIRKGPKYEKLAADFINEGAVLRELSVEEHDRKMAYVQAFTHFFSALGLKFLQDNDLAELRKASSTNFELLYHTLARISSRAPDLYAELQELNPYAITVRKSFAATVPEAAESPSALFSEVSSRIKDEPKVSAITSRFVNILAEELSLTVASLGPRGSFSEKAATEVSKFIDGPTKLSFKEDIFSILESPSDVAVVPVENSLGGSVIDAMDAILSFPRNIFLEVVVPIHHSLVALKGHGEIRKVLSHPQALAQCRDYLKKHLPGVELIKTRSTSEAIEQIVKNRLDDAAAIGREDFARSLGLEIIDRNIEDMKNNVTRFWALGNPPLRKVPAEGYRSTLLINETEDRPGLLRDILNVIADRGINLTRLESRPSKEALGKYRFFIDLEGAISKDVFEEIKKELKDYAQVQLLGTYPVWRVE